jgi:hypothetical protein
MQDTCEYCGLPETQECASHVWTHAISHPGTGLSSIHLFDCSDVKRNFRRGGGVTFAGTFDECVREYVNEFERSPHFAPCVSNSK